MDEFFRPEQEPPESGTPSVPESGDFVAVDEFVPEQQFDQQPEQPVVESVFQPYGDGQIDTSTGDVYDAQGVYQSNVEISPAPEPVLSEPVFLNPFEESVPQPEQPDQPEQQPVPETFYQPEPATGDVFEQPLAPPDLTDYSQFFPQPVAVTEDQPAEQTVEELVTLTPTMEVWNEEAPNAHATMDDYFDDAYWNTPAEEDYNVPAEEDYSGEVTGGNDFPDDGTPAAPEVVPDEFGDVYADDGTYIGNVFLNEDLTKPATELADSVHVDPTTGDLVDENGNVIGSAYDDGSVVIMGGNQNQPSGPDLIVDSQGDLYDKDGNYLGQSADTFIDEYGNVFSVDGQFLGTTVPQNSNLGSAASRAQTVNTPGSIVGRGGSGAGGGGASGSGGGGGGGGSGVSLTPTQPKATPAASTPGTTAQKVLVQQIKSGTSLVKVYSDGSRETIANYFAPAITSGITQTNPATVTTKTTPTLNNRVSGLTPSITGTPTSQNDFLAALFGNINKGLNGPGSGSVSMSGFNPGTQLTSAGKPRVAAGAAGGSTAPTRTVNSLVAGSSPGDQGNANLTQPSDVMGGQLSSGMGGIAALAIGAVALFAVAS